MRVEADWVTNWTKKVKGNLEDKVKVRKKSKRDEFNHQVSFFKYLEKFLPNTRQLSFAIPNGGKRNAIEAANLKRAGVTAGVPDIFIAQAAGIYNGLFLEIKVPGNKLTEKQLFMMKKLCGQGYLCLISYSLQESIDVLNDYLKGTHFINDNFRAKLLMVPQEVQVLPGEP